jgi:pilus assembly protein CpaB
MFLLAIVALILAVGVTAVTYQAISRRVQPEDDTTQIVVAALPVSVGAKLTELDLRLAPWPKAVRIEGSFEKISDVVGRGAVVSMVPNEPVLTTKLAASGSGAGLMAAIPDGMRAVSVKVNDVIGVAGFVVPGSRVDLILSGSAGDSGAVELAKVILENVQVLAAGQNVANDIDGKPMNVQVVTLLVTPEQSEKLALASIDGRIQLALRNPLDMQHMNPNAVRREHLFESSGASTAKPVVSKPAAPRITGTRAAKPQETLVSVEVPRPSEPIRAVEHVPVVKPEKHIELIRGDKMEKVIFAIREKEQEGSAQ